MWLEADNFIQLNKMIMEKSAFSNFTGLNCVLSIYKFHIYCHVLNKPPISARRSLIFIKYVSKWPVAFHYLINDKCHLDKFYSYMKNHRGQPQNVIIINNSISCRWCKHFRNFFFSKFPVIEFKLKQKFLANNQWLSFL